MVFRSQSSRSRYHPLTRRELGCFFQRGGRPIRAITSLCLVFPVIVLSLLYLDVHKWGQAARATSTTYLKRGNHGEDALTELTWACEDQKDGVTIGEMSLDQVLVYQRPLSGGITAKLKQFIMSLGSNLGLVDVITELWHHKQKQRLFKTSVDNIQSRHSKGKTWAAEIVFNPGRAQKPINIPGEIPVNQAFDPKGFSFMKAPFSDLMFFYESEEQVSSSSSPSSPDDEPEGGARRISCRPGPGGGGGGSGGQSASHEGPSTTTADRSSLHAVLINPWPVGPYSGVLAPYIFQGLPQQLSEKSLAVAISFMNELGSAGTSKGLRIGYNSLGAMASVNHLHYQFWSFKDSPDGLLPLERARRKLLKREPIRVYSLYGYPIKGLAFSIDSSQPQFTAQAVGQCSDYLVKHNIPHSLLMNEDMIFLLPRQKLSSMLPFATLPGFPETSGEIIVLLEDDFAGLNADEVAKVWTEFISLDDVSFHNFLSNCTLTT